MFDIEYFESSYFYDQYILALLILPKDGVFNRVKLKCWKCYSDGNRLGPSHYNPFLDTRVSQGKISGRYNQLVLRQSYCGELVFVDRP